MDSETESIILGAPGVDGLRDKEYIFVRLWGR